MQEGEKGKQEGRGFTGLETQRGITQFAFMLLGQDIQMFKIQAL